MNTIATIFENKKNQLKGNLNTLLIYPLLYPLVTVFVFIGEVFSANGLGMNVSYIERKRVFF